MMGMIAVTMFAALLISISMVFLKVSAATVTMTNFFRHVGFITGTALFGFANLFFIVVLRNNDVSIVFPLMSVQYIFAALISHLYLGEKLTRLLWVGIVCIVAGSFLILL